jgi:hypothetical protein
LQMFLLLHFLLAQKPLEGFCRESSNSSVRAGILTLFSSYSFSTFLTEEENLIKPARNPLPSR